MPSFSQGDTEAKDRIGNGAGGVHCGVRRCALHASPIPQLLSMDPHLPPSLYSRATAAAAAVAATHREEMKQLEIKLAAADASEVSSWEVAGDLGRRLVALGKANLRYGILHAHSCLLYYCSTFLPPHLTPSFFALPYHSPPGWLK